MYTRCALDLICLDCGQIGSDGFKHIHRCQEVGYRPMEAVNFLKECEVCHQYFVSVARLILHSLLHHFRLPSLMCSCGKSFYNKGVFDLHMERCHCGYHNLYVQTGAQVRATTCLICLDFSQSSVICKLFLFFLSSLYTFYLQDSPAIVINVTS